MATYALDAAHTALVRRQCEIQHATTPQEIECFTNAYRDALWQSTVDAQFFNDAGAVEGYIIVLGKMVDPRNNGYRKVPVVFANGGHGLEASLIRRAMYSFAEAYATRSLSPLEAYKEFETIHPFIDGNGRVGHLLWAIAMVREAGAWPMRLPPDVFGEMHG